MTKNIRAPFLKMHKALRIGSNTPPQLEQTGERGEIIKQNPFQLSASLACTATVPQAHSPQYTCRLQCGVLGQPSSRSLRLGHPGFRIDDVIGFYRFPSTVFMQRAIKGSRLCGVSLRATLK